MKMQRQRWPDFSEILRPETPLEQQLLQEEAFCKGLAWGQPRFGHPEGPVYKHIREVLDNIDLLGIEGTARTQLRLVAFAHDTFKYQEPKSIPRDWSKHHGILAREFMEQFTDDKTVLNLLQWHDEAFYSWRCIFVYRLPERGWQRLERLRKHIGKDLQLYYWFFKCDTETGDKDQTPLRWFEQAVPEITPQP